MQSSNRRPRPAEYQQTRKLSADSKFAHPFHNFNQEEKEEIQ